MSDSAVLGNTTTPASKRNALLALALIAPAPSIGVAIALYGNPGTVGSLLWAFAKLWFLLGPVLWFVLRERQTISLSPLSWSPLAAAQRGAPCRSRPRGSGA